MATERTWECKSCKDKRPANSMYDALRDFSTSRKCPECGAARRDLRLIFDFGLNASHSDCTVLASFSHKKPQKWKDKDGSRVEFYPFLVILQRHGRQKAVWMPYWHLVHKKNRVIKKYGQWAPFMDMALYKNLLKQAKRARIL